MLVLAGTATGLLLVLLSLFSLLFFRRDFVFLLIYLEIGVLGIVLLFATLSYIYFDFIIQSYLLILICMGAVDSIIGLVLILTYFRKFNYLCIY
jgi:NADH:ubiquinone oxidoreductase subunit K